jgi:hypothetical protein
LIQSTLAREVRSYSRDVAIHRDWPSLYGMHVLGSDRLAPQTLKCNDPTLKKKTGVSMSAKRQWADACLISRADGCTLGGCVADHRSVHEHLRRHDSVVVACAHDGDPLVYTTAVSDKGTRWTGCRVVDAEWTGGTDQ